VRVLAKCGLHWVLSRVTVALEVHTRSELRRRHLISWLALCAQSVSRGCEQGPLPLAKFSGHLNEFLPRPLLRCNVSLSSYFYDEETCL
jgi:hypothetical protein